MMRRLIFALLLVTVSAHAQQIGDFTSWGMANGQLWRIMDQNTRAMYVWGYMDGLRINDAPIMKSVLACHCTPDDIRIGVDKFYSNPEYVRLPIGAAIASYVKRANGSSEDEDRREIANMLRKLTN